jgi:hypothetical protein
MIFTAALWLAALIHEHKIQHCVLKEPLPLACTCQPPGVTFDPKTQCHPMATLPDGQHVVLLDCVNSRPGPWAPPQPCVALPPPIECEEFHCPENSPGCQIATTKQVKLGTCPKRCDVIRYPPKTMSRNWKSIVREMFSSPTAQAQLQIALESGILVSATSSLSGEVFEIASSQFSPPTGDYVILFRDPVTCNIIVRSHEIVEPKWP